MSSRSLNQMLSLICERQAHRRMTLSFPSPATSEQTCISNVFDQGLNRDSHHTQGHTMVTDLRRVIRDSRPRCRRMQIQSSSWLTCPLQLTRAANKLMMGKMP